MTKADTREWLCGWAVLAGLISMWWCYSTWDFYRVLRANREGYRAEIFVVTAACCESGKRGHVRCWYEGEIRGAKERWLAPMQFSSTHEMLRYYRVGTELPVLFNPHLPASRLRVLKETPEFLAAAGYKARMWGLAAFLPFPLALAAYIRVRLRNRSEEGSANAMNMPANIR